MIIKSCGIKYSYSLTALKLDLADLGVVRVQAEVHGASDIIIVPLNCSRIFISLSKVAVELSLDMFFQWINIWSLLMQYFTVIGNVQDIDTPIVLFY